MNEQQDQESDIDRRIREARIVPDVSGLDGVGRAVVFLANGQPAQQRRERLPYFAI